MGRNGRPRQPFSIQPCNKKIDPKPSLLLLLSLTIREAPLNPSAFSQLHAGFAVETTGDGSPTLRQVINDGGPDLPPESMHHSGGALSETLYVYGPVLKWGFQQSPSAKFFSLGLGLGYHEMFWALLDFSLEKKSQLLTSEASEPLSLEFLNWATGEKEIELYDEIARQILASRWPDFLPAPLTFNSSVSVQDLRSHLGLSHQQKRWSLLSALSISSLRNWKLERNFNCDGILYDAFSRKTSPELWSEEFLTEFLQTTAAPRCAFGTYACLAPLKKALGVEQFQLEVREGFLGKRNASLAFRL